MLKCSRGLVEHMVAYTCSDAHCAMWLALLPVASQKRYHRGTFRPLAALEALQGSGERKRWPARLFA